ncbi:MAG: aminopeptidase family protein P [Pseudomonadota bacterium]
MVGRAFAGRWSGNALKKKSGTLKALETNPIDTIWSDRPSDPINPAMLHDERYAGESSAAKRERIASKIAESGADYLVVTAADNVAWLLNIRGADIPFNPLVLSTAILKSDSTAEWFVDERKLGPDLRLANAITPRPYTAFLDRLSEIGSQGAKVLIDPKRTHQAFLDTVEKAGGKVIEGDDPSVLAKAIKNATEIQGARAAQIRDGAAVTRFLRWLDQIPLDGSETELSAAAALLAERAKDPLFQGESFPAISAQGPHAAIPHYRVTEESDRPLTADSIFLIDSGGQYLDATTDITRTVGLGNVSQEMRERFTLVLKGHIAIATAVFPKGTNGSQIDALARQALWNRGLDFDHGTGHGIGSFLCVHEGPQRISKSGPGANFEPGMIVSNEPGYYKADAYGIRIENLVLVAEQPKPENAERELLGFETLTLAPIDRRLVDPSLLTEGEIAWLDTYHARVREELTPLLDHETAAWLERATSALNSTS